MIILTSLPNEEYILATSAANIPPPYIFSFSGILSSFKMSLLVNTYLLPLIFGINGRAPVAINNFSYSKLSPLTLTSLPSSFASP